jgi:hypothetical protein
MTGGDHLALGASAQDRAATRFFLNRNIRTRARDIPALPRCRPWEDA